MLLLVVFKMRQMLLLLLLLFIILWPIRGMMMVVDVRSVPDGLLMDVNVVIGIVATVVGNAANVIVVVVFRSESWRFLFAGVGKRRMLNVIRDKCLLVVGGVGGFILLHRRRSSEAARDVLGGGNDGGIGVVLQKQVDDGSVSSFAGPMQRRPSVEGVAPDDVGDEAFPRFSSSTTKSRLFDWENRLIKQIK